MKVFYRRYVHSLKEYARNHFKFKNSWRTPSAADNRKARELWHT